MCPACGANAAVLIASVSSSGGFFAFLINRFLKRKTTNATTKK